MSWSSPYFTSEEMACSHSGIEAMNPEFMEKLTQLRADWGQPMVITSAYRHSTHPIEAAKEKPGTHASGRAVDIAIQGEDAYALLCAALGHGFTGIGVKQKGQGRFLHLDDLTAAEGWPRPNVWSY
jgi:zinc D-Ala-D-Ala carboxypeptidase